MKDTLNSVISLLAILFGEVKELRLTWVLLRVSSLFGLSLKADLIRKLLRVTQILVVDLSVSLFLQLQATVLV